MHLLRFGMSVAATAMLSACSGDDAGQARNDPAELAPGAGASEAAAENIKAAPAAAPAVDRAPTVDYMIGKWSALPEDCSEVLDFRTDGTVLTPIGEARWNLVGDQLTFHYGDGSSEKPSSIKVLSEERIEITRASGGKDIGKRC